METINDLLRALDNKVPASIAKRLEGLKKLNEKFREALLLNLRQTIESYSLRAYQAVEE